MGYSIYILFYVPTIKPCTALLINLLLATETKNNFVFKVGLNSVYNWQLSEYFTRNQITGISTKTENIYSGKCWLSVLSMNLL